MILNIIEFKNNALSGKIIFVFWSRSPACRQAGQVVIG
jgi:hypothetical protein